MSDEHPIPDVVRRQAQDDDQIGVKVNMTTYNEEGITLMGSEIARLRKEVEKLQANCDLRGLVISDLQIQMRGLLEILELGKAGIP